MKILKIHMQPMQPKQSCSRLNLPLVFAALLVLAAGFALAGCAHFQAWGQGGTSVRPVGGGAFNIPLGK